MNQYQNVRLATLTRSQAKMCIEAGCYPFTITYTHSRFPGGIDGIPSLVPGEQFYLYMVGEDGSIQGTGNRPEDFDEKTFLSRFND